jgi:hypothetical protein
MADALWVRNTDLYRKLVDEHPEKMTESLLLTADPSVFWCWQEEDWSYSTLWRFASLEEQIDIANEALALTKVWLSDAEVLKYQGVHLGELCRTTLLYTLRDALLAQRMVMRFFDQASPSHLVLPTCPRAASDGMEVVEAVLSWEAGQRGIAVERLALETAEAVSDTRGMEERIRRNLRAAVANLSQQRRLAPRTSKQVTVMFFGSGADFVNQLHVIERLRATRPYHVIHVSLNPVRATAYSRSQVVRQGLVLSLLPYRNPWQYLALRTRGKQAWQWFEHWRSSEKNGHPELFCNPELNSVFRHFFLDTIPRTAGALGTAGHLLDTYKPALVVLNNVAGSRERAIVHAARRRGIVTVQAIHSGFNDLHFRQSSTDQVWVWGEAHRHQFASLGIPDGQIQITGNPNYDYLVELRKTSARTRAEVQEQLRLDKDSVILLMATARVPHLLTFVDMEQHVLDLQALCQTLDAHPHVRLIIKPHPRYDDIALYRVMSERYPWITVVDTLMLDRLLPACDATLMVNTASTAGIEALLLDRPMIWIRPSTRYPPLFSLFEPGILTIDDRDQIAPILNQFLASPEYRETITRRERQWVSTVVTHLDGSATDSVLAEIDELVCKGKGRV